ncbi:hypothetical protein BCR42DRAFT_402667 [Absidia repens]|uniref:Uncharacterized protein n=1 Tax=Absidia repens TaxID=90262 RepID=A0A1X2IYB5_9FUNG|nr:hypothetical protein BCR42DRAFT_402667 [Absidia repens]
MSLASSNSQRDHSNSMNTQWSPTSSHQQSNNNRSNTRHSSQRHRTIPCTRSILSVVEVRFIELTRCLYQAKAIVQDLSSFHASILPTLSLSTYHCPTHLSNEGIGSAPFLQHIKQYLDEKFKKFTKLCRILMMILSRLEQNVQVKPERVQSFRNEIMEEWRVANDIKQQIQTYLHQNNHLFDGSQPDLLHETSPSPPI